MILFLDTVSSLPEFSIIEDNKIIYSESIIKNHNEKLSDSLVSAYLNLEKKVNIKSKIKLFLVNTGPGSYTSLRVGIAFFSGLSLSKNINLIGVSSTDLFKYIIKDKDIDTSCIFINSANNQNFLCLYNDKNNEYKLNKLDENLYSNNLEFKINACKIIYTNSKEAFNQKKFYYNFKIKEYSFAEIVRRNADKLSLLPKKEIISPIYVSNNQILN